VLIKMTPFQLAWDLLKADSKDPDELREQHHQGLRDLRNLFNQPTPREEEMNEAVQEADSNKSKGQELMNRLMSGDTLSTDELTHLIEWDGHRGPTDWGISPPTPRRQQKDEEAVREFVNRQPQKPNFGIPVNTEQTRLRFGRGGYEPTPLDLTRDKDSFDRLNPTGDDRPNPPYRVGDTPHRVDNETHLQRAGQRLKDKQAAAKLHLRDNPPRLERDEEKDMRFGNLYSMMSGNKDLGNVGIDDTGSVGYGEVLPAYQRQGLYGKTLQAIINERNVLHSTGNRNQNSQPFHEQFNPPNTGKHVTGYLGGDHLPHNNGTDRYTYRALPPQETPDNWGALQHDTGALPVYQQKPAEERNAISPRGDSKQRNLEDYWGLEQRFNPQFPFDRQPGQYNPNQED